MAFFGDARKKAEDRIRELNKKSKAKNKKAITEDGTVEWITTEPEIKLYGMIDRKVTKNGIELSYKVLKGWEELKNDKGVVISKNPLIEQKIEVFK